MQLIIDLELEASSVYILKCGSLKSPTLRKRVIKKMNCWRVNIVVDGADQC